MKELDTFRCRIVSRKMWGFGQILPALGLSVEVVHRKIQTVNLFLRSLSLKMRDPSKADIRRLIKHVEMLKNNSFVPIKVVLS